MSQAKCSKVWLHFTRKDAENCAMTKNRGDRFSRRDHFRLHACFPCVCLYQRRSTLPVSSWRGFRGDLVLATAAGEALAKGGTDLNTDSEPVSVE